jgi:hypothetical protein
MAKTFTTLNNEIANALRFNIQTTPPEVIEMSKLFETLEKLLKKTPGHIEGETALEEYYNKLLKLKTILGDYEKKQAIQNSANLSSSNLENTATSDPNSALSQSTIDSPLHSSTPGTIAKHKTPTKTSLGPSAIFQTPTSGFYSPIPPTKSPTKASLLDKIRQTDKSFNYDPNQNTIDMNEKTYQMSDFNDLYAKLRDAGAIKKRQKFASTAQHEMFEHIKNTLMNDSDGSKIIGTLPGLKQYILDQSPGPKTRNPKKLSAKTISAAKSANSPASTRKRGGPTGRGNLFGATKINFKRWDNFIK